MQTCDFSRSFVTFHYSHARRLRTRNTVIEVL